MNIDFNSYKPDFFIGVDPDTQTPAVAVIDKEGQPNKIWVGKSGKPKAVGLHAVRRWCNQIDEEVELRVLLGLRSVIAIEVPEVSYTAKMGRNPRDLMPLGMISSAFACYFQTDRSSSSPRPILFPYPSQWKGQVPKAVHQARIYTRLGWEYKRHGGDKTGYCAPIHDRFGIKQGDWKHAGDALGLALWAYDSWKNNKAMVERESKV